MFWTELSQQARQSSHLFCWFGAGQLKPEFLTPEVVKPSFFATATGGAPFIIKAESRTQRLSGNAPNLAM